MRYCNSETTAATGFSAKAEMSGFIATLLAKQSKSVSFMKIDYVGLNKDVKTFNNNLKKKKNSKIQMKLTKIIRRKRRLNSYDVV